MVTSTQPDAIRGRVLIAEDNDQVRRMLVKALSNAGFDVLECADGMQALRTLETRPVDIVVTDIEMPRMDGYHLLQWVRQHRPMVPCVVISGMLSPQMEARCHQLGARTCVPKPLDVSSLMTHVRALTKHRRPASKSGKLRKSP